MMWQSLISSTFGVYSVSLSLGCHARLSVQLPPATRESVNLSRTQLTPADVLKWTLGWMGYGVGGRADWVTQQAGGERLEKAMALAVMFRLTQVCYFPPKHTSIILRVITRHTDNKT